MTIVVSSGGGGGSGISQSTADARYLKLDGTSNPTGTITPATDNVINLGSSTKRFYDGYLGHQLVLGSDGSSTTPSIVFASASNTGVFRDVSGLLSLEGNGSAVKIGNGVFQTSLATQISSLTASTAAFSGAVTPSADISIPLGSSSKRWYDGYFGNAVVLPSTGVIDLSGGAGTNTIQAFGSTVYIGSTNNFRTDSANGYWIGGVNASFSSNGLSASGGSFKAWVQNSQAWSAAVDARVLSNSKAAGQIGVSVGTLATDAQGGDSSTLLLVGTDAGNVAGATAKFQVDGYGIILGQGRTTSAVSAANTAKLVHDSTKPVSLQASFDGYSFGDVFTGYTKLKAADQSVASTTLADDNDLTFSLDASSRYVFDLKADGYCLNGGGLGFDLAGTVGVRALTSWCFLFDSQFSTTTSFVKRSLGAGKSGATITAGKDFPFWGSGAIETSTAGTFKLQIATSTGGTTTLKRGSWLTVRKV